MLTKKDFELIDESRKTEFKEFNDKLIKYWYINSKEFVECPK